MLYFAASTGFIAGGPNTTGTAPFQPQTDTSYEFGSKNLFLGGKLRINGYIRCHLQQAVDFLFQSGKFVDHRDQRGDRARAWARN